MTIDVLLVESDVGIRKAFEVTMRAYDLSFLSYENGISALRDLKHKTQENSARLTLIGTPSPSERDHHPDDAQSRGQVYDEVLKLGTDVETVYFLGHVDEESPAYVPRKGAQLLDLWDKNLIYTMFENLSKEQ